MVRSSQSYRHVVLCMYPEDDSVFRRGTSCEDNMFSSEDTLDPDAMEESQHLSEEMNLDSDADWTQISQILDNQPIVLNDRMMTDAVQSPHIQSEHSYSLTLNDELPQSPFGGLPHNIKLEDYSKGSVVKTERLHHFEECYEYFEFARQPDTFTSMPSTIGSPVALTEKKCKCGYCKQSFWPEEIEEHVCIKNCSVSVARIEYPHRCDACTKNFPSKDLLKGHTCTPVDSEQSTAAPSQAQYHCVTCEAGFRFKHQLKDHVCTHQKPKPFQCQICLKHYSTKQTLKHHLILHKDKKLQHLQCTWCQKKFRSKTAFETHIRTHTKGKCYECERCGKQFLRALDLRIHRIVHTHKKPFRCKLCNQGFIDRKYLNRHMQLHSDDQPHKCKICCKGFSSQFFVERHMITHTKSQAFKCKQCLKSFKDKHHLSRHLVVHAKEEKHYYAICGKSFSQ